MKLISML